MKIATFNVNGVNGRLPVLIRRLAETKPDVACLQELKAPALHPGQRIYTFWDYFRNAWARNAGLRIDHLLLSPSIADRLVAANVGRRVRGWEKASDHAPTWTELGDRGGHRAQGRRSPKRGWEEWRMTGAH